jgi:hypothetical protein
MIECRFVTSESSFVDMTAWDRCVDPRLGHVVSDWNLSIWVGVDASIKRDSTAIVASPGTRRHRRFFWPLIGFFSQAKTSP